MNVLVTGAGGFIGKNLVAALRNLKAGKYRTYPDVTIEEIYACGRDTDPLILDAYCQKADFVFHLAGVNRPKDAAEFMDGNFGFTGQLLQRLKECGNRCPVMFASSAQASLLGRYADSAYGKSKQAGEYLLFDYADETGTKVLVYRFPNVFGKWCRPNYNSAVATFCYNAAHDLPITVHDPSVELELLYIDDLVEEMLSALAGKEHRCDYYGLTPEPNEAGPYCYVPITHRAALGEIVQLLESFQSQPKTLVVPEIPENSLSKKLYSTYLSYLPKEKAAFPLNMHLDARGSFTELLKTRSCGQMSVNISKPGITKGQHWHNSKWELFMVVSGHGLIQQRKVDTDEVLKFYVSGEKMEAVHMLPGYTHSITNLSDAENLVTVMWANEPFDPTHPDTYYQEV
ncbi:MAG: NAD-dependent epimerase/dehydratase family protein [Oscillospiraceae bacterium]